MLGIDTTFFVLELGVGLFVGSLALMADAFHMLNDIISLVVGLWAVKAAQQHANDKYSFGVGAGCKGIWQYAKRFTVSASRDPGSILQRCVSYCALRIHST